MTVTRDGDSAAAAGEGRDGGMEGETRKGEGGRDEDGEGGRGRRGTNLREVECRGMRGTCRK